jgi:hypothetical protein
VPFTLFVLSVAYAVHSRRTNPNDVIVRSRICFQKRFHGLFRCVRKVRHPGIHVNSKVLAREFRFVLSLKLIPVEFLTFFRNRIGCFRHTPPPILATLEWNDIGDNLTHDYRIPLMGREITKVSALGQAANARKSFGSSKSSALVDRPNVIRKAASIAVGFRRQLNAENYSSYFFIKCRNER